MRKIRFQKIFNEAEDASFYFAGPSNKDGTYAFSLDCPSCGEDVTVVVNKEDIDELRLQLERAKASIVERN